MKGVFNCLTRSLFNVSKDLFDKSSGSYSSLSNSLWEARVIAVISCIKEKEVRLNVLHKVTACLISSYICFLCASFPQTFKLLLNRMYRVY